jgi:hypothetical protein
MLFHPGVTTNRLDNEDTSVYYLTYSVTFKTKKFIAGVQRNKRRVSTVRTKCKDGKTTIWNGEV